MNLLLVEEDELNDGRVRLADHRAEHLLRVLGVEPGRTIRAAVIGHEPGEARVLETGDGVVELAMAAGAALSRPDLSLVVALPRPQALKRVLQYSATMGVGRIDLIRSWRVEKSYFHTPVLKPAELRRQLKLGAEQGASAWLPEVAVFPRFNAFLEDWRQRADADSAGTGAALLADPAAGQPLTQGNVGRGPLTLALGPEGGWIDRELESLGEAGFSQVVLGPWILRVETALVAALAQIELVRQNVDAC